MVVVVDVAAKVVVAAAAGGEDLLCSAAAAVGGSAAAGGRLGSAGAAAAAVVAGGSSGGSCLLPPAAGDGELRFGARARTPVAALDGCLAGAAAGLTGNSLHKQARQFGELGPFQSPQFPKNVLHLTGSKF